MNDTLVSAVVATYGRPDALKATLTSLILQRHTNWEAIVVGDCCSEETESVIRDLQDPRISYYNLPQRFGEQSGPNSFGLRLVRGEYLCFLNHDDLLLSDHLTHALSEIRHHQADLYFGKYANASDLMDDNGVVSAVFTAVLPSHREPAFMYDPNCSDLDPSSFWVVRTALAKAVGPWRPAAELWRTPISDWLLRAAKHGGTFIFGQTVTGLRIHTHNARIKSEPDRPVYGHRSPEYAALLAWMRSAPPDLVRDTLFARFANDWRPLDPDAPSRFKRFRRRIRWGMALLLYKHLGFDYFDWRCRKKGMPKGATMSHLSRYRTGLELGRPDIESLCLTDPESLRRI